MTNSTHPIIERARKSEELRLQRIEDRIRELEKAINSCNSKALSHAYILGEEKTTIEDARKISMLIAQFELDCGCSIRL